MARLRAPRDPETGAIQYTPEQLQGQSDFAKDPYSYYLKTMTPELAQQQVGKNQAAQASIDKAIKGNWLDKLMEWGPLIAFGGAVAAPAIAGAVGGGAAAGAAPALSSIPTGAALTGAGGGFLGGGASIGLGAAPALAGGSALGGGSIMGGIGMGGGTGAGAGAGAGTGAAGAGGAATAGGIKGALMNPQVLSTLIQSGLGFLGGLGGDEGDQRTSFEGTGPTDPRNVGYNILSQLYPLLQGLQDRARQGTQLKSSYVGAPPSPINIPGLPFQIGGGLATDPAFADRDLLRMPGLNIPQLAPGDQSAGGSTHPQLRSSSSSSSGGSRLKRKVTGGR